MGQTFRSRARGVLGVIRDHGKIQRAFEPRSHALTGSYRFPPGEAVSLCRTQSVPKHAGIGQKLVWQYALPGLAGMEPGQAKRMVFLRPFPRLVDAATRGPAVRQPEAASAWRSEVLLEKPKPSLPCRLPEAKPQPAALSQLIQGYEEGGAGRIVRTEQYGFQKVRRSGA